MSTEAERQDPSSDPWEAREAAAAGRDAARIGGRAGDEDLDPAQRPLAEAGEGEAEGFELAEQELIEAAEHGSSLFNPLGAAFAPEESGTHGQADYGEADRESSSEVPDSDR